MKNLLILTAVSEAATGLALLIVPSLVGRLLLGSDLTGVAIPVARVLGIALLALGVACWFASGGVESGAARGVVSAMTIYNLGTMLVLGAAGIQSPPAGILLWPTVIFHAAMAAWCIACLRRQPAGRKTP